MPSFYFHCRIILRSRNLTDESIDRFFYYLDVNLMDEVLVFAVYFAGISQHHCISSLHLERFDDSGDDDRCGQSIIELRDLLERVDRTGIRERVPE